MGGEFVHILVAPIQIPFLPFLQGTLCEMNLVEISLLVIFLGGKVKFVSLICNSYSSESITG